MSDLFYQCSRKLGLCLHLLFRFHLSGTEHLPKRGPCLLAANHISHADPVLLGFHTPRPIDFMTAAEFFVHPGARRVLRLLNAFPIDRSRRDLSAVKVAVARLKQGRLVGIFIEGGIRHGERSLLNGASFGEGFTGLAQSEGVPIVPAVILGTDQLYQWRYWLRRPRVFLRFGPPLVARPEEDRAALAQRLGLEMRELAEAMRRDYQITDLEFPRSAQERWTERP